MPSQAGKRDAGGQAAPVRGMDRTERGRAPSSSQSIEGTEEIRALELNNMRSGRPETNYPSPAGSPDMCQRRWSPIASEREEWRAEKLPFFQRLFSFLLTRIMRFFD